MKYLSETRQLLSDNGKVIKQLTCPLRKKWGNLLKTDARDTKRRCCECNKDVLDISTFSEKQVMAIVENEPDVCVCIRADSPTILCDDSGCVDSACDKTCMQASHRVIQTARSEEAGNLAVKDGFTLLIKPVKDHYNRDMSFAAYLVPKDIKVGERVYIPDVIEDHLSRHCHGGKFRGKPVTAYWNGEDFQIASDVHCVVG